MNLLFVSYPIGPLGTGIGGGVDLTIKSAIQALERRDHQIELLMPEGSQSRHARRVEVRGALQPSAQVQSRGAPISMPPGPILAAMWDLARRRQAAHDLIVNFAYDWLPFYLTPFFSTPVAHLVSMGSLLDAMDIVIGECARAFPGRVAMHTQAQAGTFPWSAPCPLLGNGLDLDRYPFNPAPDRHLCWVGRIAPEKGLEDAVALARATGTPLEIYGFVQDQAYWRRVRAEFAGAPVRYGSFLETTDLAAALGRSRALLMTSKWTEAFGNVVMEALACGVPVIAYRRGGPGEMVEDGRTGWLVEPDSIDGLIAASRRIDQIDRRACRAQAEREYSLEALGLRWERWFADLGLVRRLGET